MAAKFEIKFTRGEMEVLALALNKRYVDVGGESGKRLSALFLSALHKGLYTIEFDGFTLDELREQVRIIIAKGTTDETVKQLWIDIAEKVILP